MPKGNPNPSPATRWSSTYRPDQEKAREARWSIQAALRRIMAMDPGKFEPRTNAERVALAHYKKALKGDMPAVKEAYDRIDGKVVDKQAITDAEGNDVADPTLRNQRIAALIGQLARKPKPGSSE